MVNAWEYWADEAVDTRNADLIIDPARRDAIVRDVRMAPQRQSRHGQEAMREACECLCSAVADDIRRRDSQGDKGWDDARCQTLSIPGDCRSVSSFRAEQAMLLEAIGCDYDGYGDPRTKQGDADGLASLATELATIAAKSYANVPSLYYPLQIEDGMWVIMDIWSHEEPCGCLRVPLSSLGMGDVGTGDDLGEDPAVVALTDEWWSMFLRRRADEVREGKVSPLPIQPPIGDDGDTRRMHRTDGDIMMACADALRYWEATKADIDTMRTSGDSRSLCAIIDELIRRVRRTDFENTDPIG